MGTGRSAHGLAMGVSSQAVFPGSEGRSSSGVTNFVTTIIAHVTRLVTCRVLLFNHPQSLDDG